MKPAITKTYIAVLFCIACLIVGIGFALHSDHPHLNLAAFAAAWTENAFLASGALMIAITVIMWIISVFTPEKKFASHAARISSAQPNYIQPRHSQPVANTHRERQVSQAASQTVQKQKKAKPNRPIRSADDLELRLAEIIGLESVKETIRSIYATAKIEQQRRAQGVGSDEPMTLHMMFKGNPGTGKTTVARLVGEMFRDMGLLSTGEFVESDQATLVGQYVGETPQKVKNVVQNAMGGVLFIDEAYSLVPQNGGSGPSHTKEAIDTLIKEMEDNRGNLCVILAGYDGPMDKLLHYNEGMPSRVPFVLNFSDYNASQFMEILALETAKKKFSMTQDAIDYVRGRMQTENIGKAGNGRFARNLIEAAIRKQATRLVNVNHPSKQDLVTLTIEDFKFA